MENILIPISICVVLPVMIVWLVSRRRQNETNRKTEIMLKMIESGSVIDPNLFMEQHPKKTIKERLFRPLAVGCVFLFADLAIMLICGRYSIEAEDSAILTGAILTATGLALLVAFLVGYKLLSKEMEAERKALEEK